MTISIKVYHLVAKSAIPPIITIEHHQYAMFACSWPWERAFVTCCWPLFDIFSAHFSRHPSGAGGHCSNYVRTGTKHICKGLCQQSAAIYAFSGYGLHILVYWKSTCFKQEPDCFNRRL
jgi:hypothetical protein